MDGGRRRSDDNIMTFSDEFYDEYTLLEACLEYDFEAVQNILDDTPTDEELNERDQSDGIMSRVCIRIASNCAASFGSFRSRRQSRG